jgi:hypothetical protein
MKYPIFTLFFTFVLLGPCTALHPNLVNYFSVAEVSEGMTCGFFWNNGSTMACSPIDWYAGNKYLYQFTDLQLIANSNPVAWTGRLCSVWNGQCITYNSNNQLSLSTSIPSPIMRITRGGEGFYFLLSWPGLNSLVFEVAIYRYGSSQLTATASVTANAPTFSSGVSNDSYIGWRGTDAYQWMLYACFNPQANTRFHAFRFPVKTWWWTNQSTFNVYSSSASVSGSTTYNTRPAVTKISSFTGPSFAYTNLYLDLGWIPSSTGCYMINMTGLNGAKLSSVFDNIEQPFAHYFIE